MRKQRKVLGIAQADHTVRHSGACTGAFELGPHGGGSEGKTVNIIKTSGSLKRDRSWLPRQVWRPPFRLV